MARLWVVPGLAELDPPEMAREWLDGLRPVREQDRTWHRGQDRACLPDFCEDLWLKKPQNTQNTQKKICYFVMPVRMAGATGSVPSASRIGIMGGHPHHGKERACPETPSR